MASFREKAESQVLSTLKPATTVPKSASELNWLSGGLQVDDSSPETSLANMKVRLVLALRIFDLRFKQMEAKQDKMDEMLAFVTNLGMVQLKDLNGDDFELHIRLESLLIETLKEAYEQQTLDAMGISSTNKKLQKRKLKKKQKQLQMKALEKMSRQETQKKEAIEESRQMQLIDEAEANPQPDQA